MKKPVVFFSVVTIIMALFYAVPVFAGQADDVLSENIKEADGFSSTANLIDGLNIEATGGNKTYAMYEFAGGTFMNVHAVRVRRLSAELRSL